MRIISSSILLVLLLVIAVSGQRQPTKDIRASWIPVQELCRTESECSTTMSTLKSQGINRVYVDVWNQGKTYFNSPTMLRFVGQGGIATDQLSWGVKYAKLNGLQVFAWFEYGLVAAATDINNDFARKAQSLGWISGTAFNFVWMKPIPDVVNFLADIMIDAIKNYNIDGVQLDDHFASPTSLAGTNPAPMTTAMQTIYKRIRAVSTLPISLAPNVLSEALNKYNVDWVKWANLGIYSECAPQLYRSDYAAFKKELDNTMSNTPASLQTYMLIGMRCNGLGPITPWAELEKMLNDTKSRNLGAAVWYGKCLTQTYPAEFKKKWG